MQLKWKPNEVEGIGKAFLKVSVDTLWTIDGHYQVLGKRAHKIPQLFHKSIGYNNPEVSKHRKRNLQNLSEFTISELSNLLFAQLQCTYWERSGWQTFKSEVEKLAISLSDYSSHLREQNKKAKLLQSYTHPGRSVSSTLCNWYYSLLNDLQSCLKARQNFSMVVIEDLSI